MTYFTKLFTVIYNRILIFCILNTPVHVFPNTVHHSGLAQAKLLHIYMKWSFFVLFSRESLSEISHPKIKPVVIGMPSWSVNEISSYMSSCFF